MEADDEEKPAGDDDHSPDVLPHCPGDAEAPRNGERASQDQPSASLFPLRLCCLGDSSGRPLDRGPDLFCGGHGRRG